MRPALNKEEKDEKIKTRVQLDLAPSQMERLNRLMEVCGVETRKDLFNSALSLLEWAVLEVVKGKSIASVDKEAKHFTNLAMPALADAARYGATHNLSRIRHEAENASRVRSESERP